MRVFKGLILYSVNINFLWICISSWNFFRTRTICDFTDTWIFTYCHLWELTDIHHCRNNSPPQRCTVKPHGCRREKKWLQSHTTSFQKAFLTQEAAIKSCSLTCNYNKHLIPFYSTSLDHVPKCKKKEVFKL